MKLYIKKFTYKHCYKVFNKQKQEKKLYNTIIIIINCLIKIIYYKII